jgi:hypothetical protein
MNKKVCRHSLASFKGDVYSFGGYDGLNVNDMLQSLPLPPSLPLSLPSSINQMKISPLKTISVPLSKNKSEIENINQIEIKNRHAIFESIVDAKVEKLEKTPIKSIPEPIPEKTNQKQPIWNTRYTFTCMNIYIYICIFSDTYPHIQICRYNFIHMYTNTYDIYMIFI